MEQERTYKKYDEKRGGEDMTFWKISDSRMNCLITQAEIEALGYTLEDLTQNREKTEQFLNLLLQKGKEVLGMEMNSGIQSFYGAFLPDRSLLLSISCTEADPDALKLAARQSQIPKAKEEDGPILTYQLVFPELDNVIQFCTIFGAGKAQQSRLYEEDGLYYLMVDFPNTEDGRRWAKGIVSAGEFGGIVARDAISEGFLKEHEMGLIEEHAVEKLCAVDEESE